MPHVQQHGQVKRSGEKTRADIRKTERPSMARDDLRGAFAGRKNSSPEAKRAAKSGKASHEKSRLLRRDEGKEPVR